MLKSENCLAFSDFFITFALRKFNQLNQFSYEKEHYFLNRHIMLL